VIVTPNHLYDSQLIVKGQNTTTQYETTDYNQKYSLLLATKRKKKKKKKKERKEEVINHLLIIDKTTKPKKVHKY
jgi:hypothetical protein